MTEQVKHHEIKPILTKAEFIEKYKAIIDIPDDKMKNSRINYSTIQKNFPGITLEEVRTIALLRMEKHKKGIIDWATERVAFLKEEVKANAPTAPKPEFLPPASVITTIATKPVGANASFPAPAPKIPEVQKITAPSVPTAYLLQNPTEIKPGQEIISLKENSNVFVYRLPNIADQSKAFNRITIFTEGNKTQYGPKIADYEQKLQTKINEEEKGKMTPRTQENFFGGHDIPALKFAEFFNTAKTQQTKLNNHENELLKKLIGLGFIEEKGGFYTAVEPKKAMLVLPTTGIRLDQLKAALPHELSHGEFFTNQPFKNKVMEFWNSLRNDQQIIKDALGKNYNTEDGELMANEMQAYLLFTPPTPDVNSLLGKGKLAPEKFNDLKTQLINGLNTSGLKINPALKINESMAVVPAVAPVISKLDPKSTPTLKESNEILGKNESLASAPHTLAKALDALRKILEVKDITLGNSPEAKQFAGMKERLDKELKNPDFAKLFQSMAGKDVVKINEFLKNAGFNISLTKQEGKDGYYVASVFKQEFEWITPGQDAKITLDSGKEVDGVLMKKDVKKYTSEGKNIYEVSGKDGSTIFMMPFSGDISKNSLNLSEVISKIDRSKSPSAPPTGLNFPMVDFRQQGDIAWLKDLKIGQNTINEAKHEEYLQIGSKGVKAGAAAAMGVGRGLNSNVPEEITGPMLVWIKKGDTITFSAKIGENDMKKPQEAK